MQKKQYNDSLTNVMQFSFPANHLIIFTLIQRTPNMASQQNKYQDYHEKYFFMMSFVPGINKGAGSRGYDFQTGKYTQKFATREIGGLAEVLHQCAIGNDANVLPYAKFSRSASDTKQLVIWCNTKQQTISGQNQYVRQILFQSSLNKNKSSITLAASDAFALSQVLRKMFDKAMELEMEGYVGQPFQQNDRFQSAGPSQHGFQPQSNQNQPPQQFNPSPNQHQQNNYQDPSQQGQNPYPNNNNG